MNIILLLMTNLFGPAASFLLILLMRSGAQATTLWSVLSEIACPFSVTRFWIAGHDRLEFWASTFRDRKEGEHSAFAGCTLPARCGPCGWCGVLGGLGSPVGIVVDVGDGYGGYITSY